MVGTSNQSVPAMAIEPIMSKTINPHMVVIMEKSVEIDDLGGYLYFRKALNFLNGT